ncbi:NAD-dependent epimerase/dehydratase family protein [Aquibacillus albus]|uniref:UDP-glucose 4-epimerase n=1 Tax=Aquibacillus albus TaxID=1168171 RepID=A0ABS2N679_9BACI|nr:NAD-dependent epimerase/dehydratase family protein [Aquibacillus albus]MBM7573629.1 UDP-glucose 4-epimerase [Aquibacillus albus]
MKVLVTGGAGFIGSHVVEALHRAQYAVTIIDLSSDSHRYQAMNIPYYGIDINNKEKLEKAFELEKPDVVIHLAAQVDVKQSIIAPKDDAKTNILGTIYLLEAAKKFHVKKFIYASSAAVYGEPHYLAIDEEHPKQPLSFYGISKLTGEQYVQAFSTIHGLSYTILRYANVYGPGSSKKLNNDVINIFLSKMMNKQKPEVFGDGKQTRDFIYVKDIASATIAALYHGDNQTLNISTNHGTSINELIHSINSLLEDEVEPVYHPKREGDILDSYLDNGNAKEYLTWYPNSTLMDGLTETLSYMKQTHESNIDK